LSALEHPAYEIDVANSQTCLVVDEEFLRTAVLRTLALEEVRSAEISVAVIGNDEIQVLNRQFLEHDYATDVLSFLLECEGESTETSESASPLGSGKTISGEVIISAEMAEDRAAEFGWEADKELLLYLVHGLLHLCGYDDHSDEQRALMRSRERAVLIQWDIVPHDGADVPRSDS